MASVERVPTDYYGEALATLVAQGAKQPEMVAALIAEIGEALEDTLKMSQRQHWITLTVDVTPFGVELAKKDPPPC
jgi:hypothetical protein